jgi:hypothetical protein
MEIFIEDDEEDEEIQHSQVVKSIFYLCTILFFVTIKYIKTLHVCCQIVSI